MFDSMFSIAAASIIIIIFAAVTSQFHGLGLFVSMIFVQYWLRILNIDNVHLVHLI